MMGLSQVFNFLGKFDNLVVKQYFDGGGTFLDLQLFQA